MTEAFGVRRSCSTTSQLRPMLAATMRTSGRIDSNATSAWLLPRGFAGRVRDLCTLLMELAGRLLFGRMTALTSFCA
jgi:hypothetical protein